MNARGVNKVTSSTKRDQQGAAEDAWSSEKDNNYEPWKCHEITMKGKKKLKKLLTDWHNTWTLTSQIHNCGVFHHGHHISSCAGVIANVFFPQSLDNVHGAVDICLVAVEHPAEVCWWDRVCCALQGHPLARCCCWWSSNWYIIWPICTERMSNIYQDDEGNMFWLTANVQRNTFFILKWELMVYRLAVSSTHSWRWDYRLRSWC